MLNLPVLLRWERCVLLQVEGRGGGGGGRERDVWRRGGGVSGGGGGYGDAPCTPFPAPPLPSCGAARADVLVSGVSAVRCDGITPSSSP